MARAFLPPKRFLTLHYAYFISVCLVSSVVFWGSSTHPRSVPYTDSLFFTVSAMTAAGLNTINLSLLNTFQQFLLFALMLLGSPVLTSSVMLHVRKKAFEKKFQTVIEEARRKERERRRSLDQKSSFLHPLSRAMSFSRKKSTSRDAPEPEVHGVERVPNKPDEEMQNVEPEGNGVEQGITNKPDEELQNLEPEVNGVEQGITNKPEEEMQNLESDVDGVEQGTSTKPEEEMQNLAPAKLEEIAQHRGPEGYFPNSGLSVGRSSGDVDNALPSTNKYFPSAGFIGRNSEFHGLTPSEREQLGGIEYKAIILLACIIPLYYVLWQLLGSIGVGAWIAIHSSNTTLQNGLNPWWVGAFNAISAFSNCGMSLLDANMVAFQTSVYMLIIMGLLILAGNTCYPIFLRLILWCMERMLSHSTPDWHERKMTLRFLLDHPRRCYTNLFPSAHTWWLLGSVVLLTCIDWVAFIIFNTGNSVITDLPPGTRVLDGLFQAVSVRNGGFYVVPIAKLRIDLLVLYVIMMYISVYPVVITMRNSNVYEERSLGIYSDNIEMSQNLKPKSSFRLLKKRFFGSHSGPMESRTYFVRQQLRDQLAHDLWWITLSVLFIMIIESGQFDSDPVNYSVFNVIFEVISAYGCVGISVGLPNVEYSFSGGWHGLSKLILCTVMLRGKHRGLPAAIDRAVLLPSEHLGAAEEQDELIRLEKTRSRVSDRV